MNYILFFLFASGIFLALVNAQPKINDYEVLKIDSRIPGLKLALLHLPAKNKAHREPVLFIHGSSFPAELAFGFRMNGVSWMDELSDAGYDVYALDFLGYGASDRYPEMSLPPAAHKPLGRAGEVYHDIDKAADFIIKKCGVQKVNIIAHSWGGSVAALYANKYSNKINKLVLFSAITVSNPVVENPEAINTAYESMTPEERVKLMKGLTPAGEQCRLENELFTTWKEDWLESALPFQTNTGGTDIRKTEINFPAGPSEDISELEEGHSYYSPDSIYCPVLLIRGEWDKFPSWKQAETLYKSLKNARCKRYIVIEKATHVMHLEKNRFQLYDEVKQFLNEDLEKE